MQQVVQNIRTGATTVQTLPDPVAPPGGLVVANAFSAVSGGTERYVVDLANKSLLGKARSRPDHVRRVLQKIKQEGLLSTASQVMAKLNEPMPLGYSTAGVVLECGRGVQEFKPGDRVATAAPHAGVVALGRNLCARVPDSVELDEAAYAAIAAIALQGVRLARPTLGGRIVVIGLGLIGQMALLLAKAHGCHVFGVDPDKRRLAQVRALGDDEVATGDGPPLATFVGSQGVDAVIIAASTPSSEPLHTAAKICQRRGRVVQVGATGLDVPRPEFFAKELELVVSSSLGPGRGDLSYEERGVDYPIAHARWTAQRNMQAALDAMASGALPMARLTSHRYPILAAPAAYELLVGDNAPQGILLEYPAVLPLRRRATRHGKGTVPQRGELGLSLIGAGNFARLVLAPRLATVGKVRLRGLASARGLNALQLGQHHGFAFVATDAAEILADPETSAVCIATRHDSHAELIIRALRAGKHVFVEKPLCIDAAELQEIDACIAELGDACPMLAVGYNRRFAAATTSLRQHFAGAGPLSVSYRFACGPVPADAWPHDEIQGGGRIVGEACHALDLCNALVGAGAVRVFAESAHSNGGASCVTDDRVFITTRHTNGSICNISYQAGGDRAGPAERLEVFGGDRSAVLDDWRQLDLWAAGKQRRLRLRPDKGHAGELRTFVQRSLEGGAWPIPWTELRNATWSSLAAVASLRSGLAIGSNDELDFQRKRRSSSAGG